MRRRCPNLNCRYSILVRKPIQKKIPVVKKGFFYRKSDRRKITRYRCLDCKTNFSAATFSENYREKRRDLNHAIFELLCSGVSQRRLAATLNVNPKTVVRKFRKIAHQSRVRHRVWLDRYETQKISHIQFDDLETIEHTKCKPVSISIAVNPKTREILGFSVSQMPAKGHLSKIARRKYGLRTDKRPEGWIELFKSLQPIANENVLFESDDNPHYPKFLKQYFLQATHVTYLGGRGAITGQGELKKLRYDPLFTLNHTCAMLRANLNRLFRRSWCTTKNIQGLVDHLSIYVIYHNLTILPRLGTFSGGSS